MIEGGNHMSDYEVIRMYEISKALETLNEYIVEDGLDLSILPDQLDGFDYINIDKVRIALENIKESLKYKEPTIKPEEIKHNKTINKSWFNPNTTIIERLPIIEHPISKQETTGMPIETCTSSNIFDKRSIHGEFEDWHIPGLIQKDE